MEVIPLDQLSKPVQAFLAKVRGGPGVVIEDDQGRGLCGVIPYFEASPRVQRAALKRLERLQKKVAVVMKKRGKTEEEFDRLGVPRLSHKKPPRSRRPRD